MNRLQGIVLALAVSLLIAATPDEQPTSPVIVLYASGDMAPECIRAAQLAAEHIQTRGAELELVVIEGEHPEDHRAFWAPRAGEATLRTGLPSQPRALTETAYVRDESGTVLSADIVTAHCSAVAIGHALAHVLGLERQVDLDALWHADE